MSKRQRTDSLTANPAYPPSNSTSSTARSSTSTPNTTSSSSPTPPSIVSNGAPQHEMLCILPPHPPSHPLRFTSYADYETHYLQAHTNRCSDCGLNFPSARFLEVHILDVHDALGEVRRGRGEKTVGFLGSKTACELEVLIWCCSMPV